MTEETDRNRRMGDFVRGVLFGCCMAGGVHLATLAQLKPEAIPSFWILWTMSAALFLGAFLAYLYHKREMKA